MEDNRLSPSEVIRQVSDRENLCCPHCRGHNLKFEEKGEKSTPEGLKPSWEEQTCLDCGGKCEIAWHIIYAFRLKVCGKDSCRTCEKSVWICYACGKENS